MGGFSFTKDTDRAEEISYMNLPARNIWIAAVIAAGEIDFLNHARCPADTDGDCQRNRCLNENGTIGQELPLRGFLAMNQRVLSFVESYHDQFNDKVKEQYRELADFTVSAGESEWVITKEMAEKFVPDIESTASVIKRLIKDLSTAGNNGTKSAFVWDRLSDTDCYPCPRVLPTDFREEYQLHGDRKVKARIIDYRFLSYGEAIEKQKSGEWGKNMENIFWGREA